MNFVVLAPLRKRRAEVAALRPEAWGMGRRLAVLLAPVAAGGVLGFDPGRVVWAWLALGIVALEFAGHIARRGDVPVSPRARRRWRRQLRRRRIINRRQRIYAQRQKARAIRDARERRTRRRRMRRRRLIQSRTLPSGWGWRPAAAAAGDAAAAAPGQTVPPAAGDARPTGLPRGAAAGLGPRERVGAGAAGGIGPGERVGAGAAGGLGPGERVGVGAAGGLGPGERVGVGAAGGLGPGERVGVGAAVEIDLREVGAGAAVEIDLVERREAEGGNEIDLTDCAGYESEITLESGETLECGVVKQCREPSAGTDHR